jgi:CheY-like chemotaxis protein
MPTVLVVEDSTVDRRLISGLLEKKPGYGVVFASQGAEGLARMQENLPDAVITDLVMPDMDGLELVSALRREHPSVPVILITSGGSEEIAVKALQAGASSYVPKRLLARDLIGSLEHVLAVSGARKRHARLIQCMRRNECSFVLDNDDSLFPPLIGFLQDGAVQIGAFDEAERIRIGIALEEALANALFHGNLEIDSSLREHDPQAYEELIASRSRHDPYRSRRIHVHAHMTPDDCVFTVRDEGPGFDPGSLPDPTDPANLEKVSGRGVLLMRSFMDCVTYNSTGNEVTMIKRGPART